MTGLLSLLKEAHRGGQEYEHTPAGDFPEGDGPSDSRCNRKPAELVTR